MNDRDILVVKFLTSSSLMTGESRSLLSSSFVSTSSCFSHSKIFTSSVSFELFSLPPPLSTGSEVVNIDEDLSVVVIAPFDDDLMERSSVKSFALG